MNVIFESNQSCLHQDKSKTRKGRTYAPLYCATSSPSINTFSLPSSSSANASFNASLTVISFVPLGVAYCLELDATGIEAAKGRSAGLRKAVSGLEPERSLDVGRSRWEATMANAVDHERCQWQVRDAQRARWALQLLSDWTCCARTRARRV